MTNVGVTFILCLTVGLGVLLESFVVCRFIYGLSFSLTC